MNIRLRRVDGPDERRALGALLDRGRRETALALEGEPPVAEPAASFLARVGNRPETLVLVAEPHEDPQPRGLCLTAPLDDPVTGTAVPLLVALWVDPSLRRRGLARELLKEARRLLAADGLPSLTVRVPHGDDALLAMGERLEFERVWEFLRG